MQVQPSLFASRDKEVQGRRDSRAALRRPHEQGLRRNNRIFRAEAANQWRTAGYRSVIACSALGTFWPTDVNLTMPNSRNCPLISGTIATVARVLHRSAT